MDQIEIHKRKNFNIDISTRCTLQCSECVRTRWKTQSKKLPGGDMTLAQFDKLSNFFQGRIISFCGTWSDPIYNPNFVDMLKMCKDKNIKAEVHTAASHRPESWYKQAFRANINARWIFGIDGLPEQSHIYRKNQDGVKLFSMLLLAKSIGIITEWQYLVFNYNKDNIERATEMAQKAQTRIKFIYTNRK